MVTYHVHVLVFIYIHYLLFILNKRQRGMLLYSLSDKCKLSESGLYLEYKVIVFYGLSGVVMVDHAKSVNNSGSDETPERTSTAGLTAYHKSGEGKAKALSMYIVVI